MSDLVVAASIMPSAIPFLNDERRPSGSVSGISSWINIWISELSVWEPNVKASLRKTAGVTSLRSLASELDRLLDIMQEILHGQEQESFFMEMKVSKNISA